MFSNWAVWCFLCCLEPVLAGNHHRRTLCVSLLLQSRILEAHRISPWWLPSDHFHFRRQRLVLQQGIRRQCIRNSTCQWLWYKGCQAWFPALDRTWIKYRYKTSPAQSSYFHSLSTWSAICSASRAKCFLAWDRSEQLKIDTCSQVPQAFGLKIVLSRP